MDNTKSVYFQKSEDTAVISNETGEVLSESHSYTEHARIPVEPPFVKVYLDCLAKFKDVQFSFNPILLEFLKRASWADEDDVNGGLVLSLTKYTKEGIAKKCNVSLKRVEQALTEFVKKGYFNRIAVATYQLNADLFGKGHWKDIYKVRTIQAEFDFGAGTVVANIVKDEDEIAEKSFEELTVLEKKKRLEELDKVNIWNSWGQLTETDKKLLNERLYRFVMETGRPYPDEEIMHFLETYDWTFEKIADYTGYTVEYVKEVNELYEYLQAKKHKQSEQEE